MLHVLGQPVGQSAAVGQQASCTFCIRPAASAAVHCPATARSPAPADIQLTARLPYKSQQRERQYAY